MLKSINEIVKENEDLWDLFAKKEEYNPKFLDEHQRFSYNLSKYRDVLEPKVSDFLISKGFKTKYPEGKKFAVCLTHDIDTIYIDRSQWKFRKGYVKKLIELIKKGRIRASSKALRAVFSNVIKKWNPLLNFQEIIEIEKKYKAKSSFYFSVSEKEKFGPDYNIKDFKKELKYIIDNGCEVGLHGGYYAYNDFKKIISEKKYLESVLGQEVIGYRNHYLRFKVPNTWEALSKAGFKYETTFGYADMIGFRNGICFPFKPFNLNTNREINILEIPLNIMDCTLFKYMGLNIKDAWDYVKLVIDNTEKYGGVITILWHNSFFDDVLSEDKKEFYKRILEYCFDKNAWLASGEEIMKNYEYQKNQ